MDKPAILFLIFVVGILPAALLYMGFLPVAITIILAAFDPGIIFFFAIVVSSGAGIVALNSLWISVFKKRVRIRHPKLHLFGLFLGTVVAIYFLVMPIREDITFAKQLLFTAGPLLSMCYLLVISKQRGMLDGDESVNN